MASRIRGLLGRAAVAISAAVGGACVTYGAGEPVAYREAALAHPAQRSLSAPVDPDPRVGWGQPREDSFNALSAIARASNTALERVLVTELNRTRRAAGLHGLRAVTPLRSAGRAHASVLALNGAFTHNWPKTEAPFVRWIVRFYPAWRGRRWMAGENLLWAEVGLTAQQAVRMWLESPEHRRILLASTWREIGVGVVRVRGAGGVYGRRDVYVVAAEFGAR